MAALPTVELDPPTISMTFGVNDSPLAGRDGTHVSLRICFQCVYFVLELVIFILYFHHITFLLFKMELMVVKFYVYLTIVNSQRKHQYCAHKGGIHIPKDRSNGEG